ncbi:MAG: 3-hydroxybutyryl-CoA dehydrogenase, partial [Desulfobacteraceae bacterium]|nr:3-hydroxybutyryl-CoA dehydrogenase [Desulfobacteraceae bacterium]
MSIQKFGVIGSGQMGNGIAQVAAASGLEVLMSDIKEEFCEKGVASISRNLDFLVKKEKITSDDKSAILGRINTTVDLKDMGSVDFVVEAAVEREDLKFGIFKDLDKFCPPEVILSTNTSSIPIGRIAAQTSRPD